MQVNSSVIIFNNSTLNCIIDFNNYSCGKLNNVTGTGSYNLVKSTSEINSSNLQNIDVDVESTIISNSNILNLLVNNGVTIANGGNYDIHYNVCGTNETVTISNGETYICDNLNLNCRVNNDITMKSTNWIHCYINESLLTNTCPNCDDCTSLC